VSADLPVSQLMRRDLLECPPTLPVREAAARMNEARCGSILVVDGDQPVGIWTERDAVAATWGSAGDLERPVADFMSAPVKTIAAQATLGEAARRFRADGVRHFLVTDAHQRRLGIVSQTDVVSGTALPPRDVASLISGVPVCVDGATPFAEVRRVLRERQLDCVVVLAGQRYGIITLHDVVAALGAAKVDASAGELASFPLLTIDRDGTLFEARELFARHRIRHLGVLDDRRLLAGLLSFRDVFDNIERDYVNALLPELEAQTAQLLQAQRELQRQAQLTDAILNALPINVFVKDAQGRLIVANEMTARTLGRPLAEIVGHSAAQFVAPQSSESARWLVADDEKVSATGQTLINEAYQPDGRTLLCQKRMVEVDGAALLVGAAMDVSAWKRADALLVSEHRILELIAGGSELPVVLDVLCQRLETHLPGALCSILLRGDVGAPWRHGAAPSLPADFVAAIDDVPLGPERESRAAFLGEQVSVDDLASSPRWAAYADLAGQHGLRCCWTTPFLAADNQVLGAFAIYYRQLLQPGDSERYVIAHAARLATVAVERWRQVADLQRLATTDLLTGLRNRAYFMDSAATELRRFDRFKRELTMLMIDLDFFKLINDRHGHAAGDEALRVFARVLVGQTRAFDLLGRIGGEEFAVLLSETGGEAGVQIAERLRQAIEQASFVFHDSGPIRFTVSVGVAPCRDGDSLDSLLARADDALYRAKHAGRNRVEVG
jgi:diguanylate cyclase (GGDEF)-like protein